MFILNIQRQKWSTFLIIFSIWIGCFWWYGTTFPFDRDSVNYALGIVEDFNVVEHKPHPPGYFFHILFGKILHLFLKNPFQVQEIENIFYLIIFLLVLFHLSENRWLILFFSTFPIFLFFVGAPVHYAALVCFSSLISYLEFSVIEKKSSPLWLIVVFAIAIGFRQDLSFFLFPSILYSLWVSKPSKKEILIMIGIFTAVTLTWFIPTYLTIKIKGKGNPISFTLELFLFFTKSTSLFFGAPLKGAVRCGLRFILFSVAVFGVGGLVYLFFSLKKASKHSLLLLLLGIVPSLFVGIFIHGPKPGYYATALGYFLVWSLKFASPNVRPSFLFFLICINIISFFTFPSYSHYIEKLQKEKGTLPSNTNYLEKAINLFYSSMGRSSMKELLYYRDLYKRADSLYRNSNIIDKEALDNITLYYFTYYVWQDQTRMKK